MSDRGKHHFRNENGGVVGERSEGDTPAQRRKYFDQDSVAGVVIDSEGMSVIDTAGHPVYEAEFPTEFIDATEEDRRQWELAKRASIECLDCGDQVPSGALYCQECAPYGFWHWLKHFSLIRWAK